VIVDVQNISRLACLSCTYRVRYRDASRECAIPTYLTTGTTYIVYPLQSLKPEYCLYSIHYFHYFHHFIERCRGGRISERRVLIGSPCSPAVAKATFNIPSQASLKHPSPFFARFPIYTDRAAFCIVAACLSYQFSLGIYFCVSPICFGLGVLLVAPAQLVWD
jgi:hypothetical protein